MANACGTFRFAPGVHGRAIRVSGSGYFTDLQTLFRAKIRMDRGIYTPRLTHGPLLRGSEDFRYVWGRAYSAKCGGKYPSVAALRNKVWHPVHKGAGVVSDMSAHRFTRTLGKGKMKLRQYPHPHVR